MDRVKLISTMYNVELAKVVPTGASKGTPSIYPYYHLDFLAKKYNCSVNTIMLWFLRLCANKFLELLVDANGTNTMEQEIKRLSNRLKCQFNADITKCITSCLMLSYMLRAKNPDKVNIPELTSSAIMQTLRAMHFIAIDIRAHKTRSLVKANWDANGRPEAHPWKAISRLKASSIDLAVTNLQEEFELAKRDLARLTKTMFTAFALKDGFSVGSGIVYITSAWEESRMHAKDFAELAKAIHAQVDAIELEALVSPAKTNADHLYAFSYDADKLAKSLKA